ncbi:MAG: phosphoribosylamine--glycine ligase [Actinomycetota bacterium]|nr:phosphoribosylamine--glycine ligase [Actinomycetota bacterium]
MVVIGAGGREHALVRALQRSPQRPEVLAAPGNAGILAQAPAFAADPEELENFAQTAERERVDLVVVGPEAPLVSGLVDALKDRDIAVLGPSKAAAQLEASKIFAKEIMEAAGVPTAAYCTVSSVEAGLRAIESYPAVLKFDGLAGGKGVVIAADEPQARSALAEMLEQRRFGAGSVVVEDFLEGEELSLLALCDGVQAVPLAPARDFKRIGEGDTGPNTGGMGAFSPVPGVSAEMVKEIVAAVHQPVVDELRRRGMPFHGVLYAGLMLGSDGFKTLEFNVRFGDPETQAVLPRLRTDLVDLLLRASREDGLKEARIEWDRRSAVTVVLASRGYPASSSCGDVISGLDRVPDDVEVTHAGTSASAGDVVTAGGRVLNVTALGNSVEEARTAAYAAADLIEFDGRQMRRDIAAGQVERERNS